MKIDILDINKFIETYKVKEVSNPVYLNAGNIPTSDGLFSYEIFGRPASKNRKENFGYINLKKKFVHPSVFFLFKSLSGKNNKLIDLILCKRFFKIDESGDLVEDSENGKTGVGFLYDNYEKITLKDTGSKSRKTKLSLLGNLKKSEVFINKFLVIPCYYRDINLGSNGNKDPKMDDINRLYNKLIMLTQTISEDEDDFDFMGLNTESSIQTVINEIYSTLTGYLSGKKGIIHQGVLGKTVDYSTRSVISTQRFKAKTYKEIVVPFGYTGVPVTQLVTLFYPFYVKFIQDFMQQHENDVSVVNVKTKEKLNNRVDLKEIFSEGIIKKLLERFIKTEEDRFQILTVEDDYGNEYKLNFFTEELKRDFTLMDLIFLASTEICENKHCYITRYPIEQYQNIYPSKISILSTNKTIPMTIENKYLPHYPYVIPEYPANDSEFVGTVVLNVNYLKSLGADFDGDTVSLRGVYSVEANIEADKIIKSKINILDQSGNNSRTIGNEAVQAIYTLTRM